MTSISLTSQLDSQLPAWRQLRDAARAARQHAWSPYSHFQVGAAVLAEDGTIIIGCNVENASYGLTICAERVAVCSAIAGGRTKFLAVAVSLTDISVPCGACRQFLSEFNPDMLVLLDQITDGDDRPPELVRLSDLFPRPFRLLR